MERFDDAPEMCAGANADEGACGLDLGAAFSRDAHETASAMFSCFNPAFALSLVFIQPQIEMLKNFMAIRAFELAELKESMRSMGPPQPAGEGRGARGGEPR